MSMSIWQHSGTRYSVGFNNTDIILSTVTCSGIHVEMWLQKTLRIHRSRLRKLIIGLDLEWCPSFGPVQNPVAVLQLCVGRRCLVFLLLHADYIPVALLDFLLDYRFTFVGVGIQENAFYLMGNHGISVRKAIDLRILAAERMNRPEMYQKGLAGLAEAVLGVEWRKPLRVTMSRWDQRYLTDDQIMYATVDAFLSFKIGRQLVTGDS